MENVVHPVHRVLDAGGVADIPDVILDFVVVVGMAHVVLLFLVPGEDADLPDVGLQKAFQHGVAERAGSPGDQQCFSGKQHMRFLLKITRLVRRAFLRRGRTPSRGSGVR